MEVLYAPKISKNEEILGDIFQNSWNCQILFRHNLRNLSEVAKLG